MAQKKVEIYFEDAIRLILAHAGAEIPALVNHPENVAIVSHWLQDTNLDPILLESSIAGKWKKLLFSYQQFEKSGLNGHQRKSFVDRKTLMIKYDAPDKPVIPFPPPVKARFTFIDLFAGIGGFRIALEQAGGKCVFSCDVDRAARETYYRNFGELPFGDIRQFTGIEVSDDDLNSNIPDHDVLAAGFPCQPFSRAGVSARNSLDKDHGFQDEILGTLFFDIVRIAMVKRPRVLFLENVKNLLRHDGGNTFRTMKRVIEDDLGYRFHHDVIDASRMVPQRRERAYMICLRDGESGFEFPEKLNKGPKRKLKEILEEEPDEMYTISERLWEGHQKRTQRNLDRGTGFTAFLADPEKPANTLVARYGKDGKECLIEQEGQPPRMLTIREAARLQGFPEEFIPADTRTRAYRQFGNAVPVPVATEIAKALAKKLK